MAAAVFISHSSIDRKVAETICEALENRGLDCWIACRDVGPGENFQEAIVHAIRAAKVMVLVFTAAANNSNEIKKELALGSRYNLTVIPVRMEDIIPSDAFELELATRQWIDFFGNWEHAIERLAKNIAVRVGAAERKTGGTTDPQTARPSANGGDPATQPVENSETATMSARAGRSTAAKEPDKSDATGEAETAAAKPAVHKAAPRQRRKQQHPVSPPEGEAALRAPQTGLPATEPEERFDLYLLFAAQDQRISTIKLVHELQNSGLAEAHAVVEKLPSLILTGVPRSAVDSIKASFVSVGAILDVRPSAKPGRTGFDAASAHVFRVQSPAPGHVPQPPRPAVPISDPNELFDVVLKQASADKIGTIKVVRMLLGSSLVEARAMVENLPSTVMSGVPKRTADATKDTFLSVSALVDIRHTAPQAAAKIAPVTPSKFDSLTSTPKAPSPQSSAPTGLRPSSLPEHGVKAPAALPESAPRLQHPPTPRALPEPVPSPARPRGLPEALPSRDRKN